MSMPAMMLPPLVMARLEKTNFVKNRPWIKAPASVALAGICFTFATPLACAIFPQISKIALEDLEPDLQVFCLSMRGSYF